MPRRPISMVFIETIFSKIKGDIISFNLKGHVLHLDLYTRSYEFLEKKNLMILEHNSRQCVIFVNFGFVWVIMIADNIFP